MWRNNIPFHFRHTTHIGANAYPAIMPSGFQIVQSTLLKIDGFKLNLDNIESLNKFSIYFLLVLIKKTSVYLKAKNFFAFQKLNNLRLVNY